MMARSASKALGDLFGDVLQAAAIPDGGIFEKSAYTSAQRYFISSAAAAIVKRYNG